MTGPAEDAAERIAREHGYTLDQIRAHNRHRERVKARRRIAAMLRADPFRWSYPRIGGFLDRDHTTIMYLLDALPWRRPKREKVNAESFPR